MIEETWILGEGDNARWHLGVERASAYEPGRTHWVTACAKRQIGGAFGPRTHRGRPSELEHAHCQRCLRRLPT